MADQLTGLLPLDLARRNLNLMVQRVEAGGLSPEAFTALTTELYGHLNEIEVMLESAGLLDLPTFTAQVRLQATIAGLPVTRARFVRHLAVIEGDRP